MESRQNFSILERFPLVSEFMADIGIGYLVILFFYPFLHFLLIILPSGSINSKMLLNIFKITWKNMGQIGYMAGLLSILIAFILGISSRHFTWLFASFLKKMEVPFAWCAYKTLQFQFGEKIFSFEDVQKHLINTSPFWNVGDKNYAAFRVSLVSTTGNLKKYRPHWCHEEFLWFLYNRLYCFSLAFFICYLFYSIGVILMSHSFSYMDILAWILFLSIIILSIFSFYRGHIFHGMAFVTVNAFLMEKFMEQQHEVTKENSVNNRGK